MAEKAKNLSTEKPKIQRCYVQIIDAQNKTNRVNLTVYNATVEDVRKKLIEPANPKAGTNDERKSNPSRE